MKKYLISLLVLCLCHAGLAKAENTDISTMENVIYVTPQSAATGSQVDLSICMKNAVPIRGFQFDLYLPDGVTAVTAGSGRIKSSLSAGRLPADDEHTLTLGVQEDGAIRFLCGSQYDETFTGMDGEVATLTVAIAVDMALGDYPILLKAMKLTETDISKFYETEQVETTLTVTEPVDTRVILDENATTVPEATDGEVEVTVQRTIKAGEWSTICLPFAMTAAQVTEAFGTDVQLADFVDYDAEEDDDENIVGITVNFEAVDEADGMEANYPYLIKVAQNVTDFTLTTEITPDEEGAVVEYDNGKSGSRRQVYGTFQGVFHAGDVIPAKCLFLSDNKFWYSAGLTKLKAFRGYFDFVDVLSSVEDFASVKFSFLLDGTATHIHEMVNGNLSNGQWYDLSGRNIATPHKKGVYVIDGKKAIIK